MASSTTLDTLGTFLDMNSQADPPGVEGSSEEIDALISTIEEKAELSKRLGGRVSALKLRCRLACLSHGKLSTLEVSRVIVPRIHRKALTVLRNTIRCFICIWLL